jgi:hypothetical protein
VHAPAPPLPWGLLWLYSVRFGLMTAAAVLHVRAEHPACMQALGTYAWGERCEGILPPWLFRMCEQHAGCQT